MDRPKWKQAFRALWSDKHLLAIMQPILWIVPGLERFFMAMPMACKPHVAGMRRMA